MKRLNLVWYWGGGGVKRAGPYPSQLAACNAAQLADGSGVVEGFHMWCEKKK